jgi:Asp/Glu/hydantoin racemase
MLKNDHVANRIILIHALAESVAPIHAAFQRNWPDARYFDLLDTALSADLATEGKLSPRMRERFLTLGHYAAAQEGMGGTTAAILFTCSAFGPAIDAVKAALPIPVLRPNEAAFAAALSAGKRIGLLVTFEPSLAALSVELKDMAAAASKTIDVTARFVDGALAALQRGDPGMHDRLIADAANAMPDQDVLILGQFSMARASAVIPKVASRRLITTPDAAVLALRHLIRDCRP